MLFHGPVGEGRQAVDAALRGEAAVGLDDELVGDAGLALEAVDVLRVDLGEEALLGEERDEDVREGRLVVAGVELFGEDVEGFGVGAEVRDVEDGFGSGEVEAAEVGVETGFGGAEVGNWKEAIISICLG